MGSTLDVPATDCLGVDGAGNVYVAGGGRDNAFKIDTPGTCNTDDPGNLCSITHIIDATGDGSGNVLTDTRALAVRPDGIVYVAGFFSDNVFRVGPAGPSPGTRCESDRTTRSRRLVRPCWCSIDAEAEDSEARSQARGRCRVAPRQTRLGGGIPAAAEAADFEPARLTPTRFPTPTPSPPANPGRFSI